MTGPERSPAEALRAATSPDAAQTVPTIEVGPTVQLEPVGQAQPTATAITVPPPGLPAGAAVARVHWWRRPGGRFAIPLVAILLLLTATAASGGWLVPRLSPRPAAAPRHSTQPSGPEGGAPTLANPFPVQPVPSTSSGGQVARQVDALLGWAQNISSTVAIPPVALAAYGYAQLSVDATTPGCHLTWTTLAGIGKVESNHGSANNATLLANGMVEPPILGDVLNGQGGRALVTDTDGGRLDTDPTYDRAVGPMQFLPSTWEQFKADGDQDGQESPNDINDAALAAANYLCSGGRDLATSAGWWSAINAYNAPNAYAQSVFNAADQYGKLSRP